jgi:hypothetical protein
VLKVVKITEKDLADVGNRITQKATKTLVLAEKRCKASRLLAMSLARSRPAVKSSRERRRRNDSHALNRDSIAGGKLGASLSRSATDKRSLYWQLGQEHLSFILNSLTDLWRGVLYLWV